MSLDRGVLGRRVGGGALLAVAAFMFLGFMTSGGSFGAAATIVAFLITVALPAITGGLLIRSSFVAPRALTERQESLRLETIEAEILRLAQRSGGRLTTVEVAGELGIPAATAEKVLHELMAREVADVAVSDSGLVVYTFPEIMVLAEKEQARGLLEGGPDRGFGVDSAVDRREWDA